MNALAHLAPSESIAWLAVDSVLLVTAVIAVAYVAAILFARRHAALRSSIWMTALACVLVSPVAAYLSARSEFALIAIPWSAPTISPESLTRSESPVPAAPAVSRETYLMPPPVLAPVDPTPLLPDTDHLDAGEIASSMGAVRESLHAPPATPVAPAPPVMVGQALAGLANVLWMMGALYLLARLCVGWTALLRRTRTARLAPSEKIQAALAETTTLLDGRRLPKVMISEQIKAPLAVGIVRLVVLIPASLAASASDDQLRAILLHEFAHHFRHDLLACVFQRLATALFWPHPLIWVLNRELTRAREEACDNFALQAIPAPNFARILLQLTEALTARPEPQAALGLGSTWNLEDRVAGLLDKRRNITMRANRWARWGVVTLLIGAMTGVAGMRFVEAAAEPAATEPPKPAPAVKAESPLKAEGDSLDKRTLALRVVDANSGKPLPRTRVLLAEFPDERELWADEQGRLSIPHPKQPDTWLSMDIQAAGFVPQRVAFSAALVKPLPLAHTVKLLPGTRMSGRIEDEAGRPIAGATIYLWGKKYTTRVPEEILFDLAAVTDASGRWQSDSIPADVKQLHVRLTHPEYIDDDLYGRRKVEDEDIEKFRSGAIVFVMKKGVSVTGRVIDANGKPLPGVVVGQGSAVLLSNDRPGTITDTQGRFRFAGVAPGELTLITEAPGYSLAMASVKASEETPPVEIRLEPAHPFHGRVVDKAGKPIARAFVNVDTWRGFRSFRAMTFTDKEGRFEWTQAPADTVLVNVSAKGYTSVFQKAMVASPSDQLVTLSPVLTVGGRVVDATTGKPVPKFTIAHEHADQSWGRRSWETKTYSGGKYEFTTMRDFPGHLLRVEADGYAVAVSRKIATSEGNVVVDFQLQPDEGPHGIVQLADGAPVPSATVAIYSKAIRPYIEGGKLRQQFGDKDPVVTTGSDGTFRLPSQVGPFAVLAIHEQGYADVSEAALKGSPKVTLQPWGRIEGVVKFGAKPAAGYEVSYRTVHPLMSASGSAVADELGRFRLDRVPPDSVQVYLTAPKESSRRFYRLARFLEVKPGEAIALQLGGNGRTVKGRLTASESQLREIDFGTGGTCHIHEASYQDAVEKGRASNDPEWLTRLLESPEGRAGFYGAKRTFIGVNPDGSFEIEDVSPGEYILSVGLNRKRQTPTEACGMKSMATLEHRFQVPALAGADDKNPLDLGDLPLNVLKLLQPGDAAPDFAVKAVDGSSIRLSDYRGKFVLLHFWATWCAPCVAELSTYQRIQAELAKGGRLVIIGLSLDNEEKAHRDFVEQQKLAWKSAYVGDFSTATLDDDYGVNSIPDSFLIGPDGKIIAAHLSGMAVESEVARALGGGR